MSPIRILSSSLVALSMLYSAHGFSHGAEASNIGPVRYSSPNSAKPFVGLARGVSFLDHPTSSDRVTRASGYDLSSINGLASYENNPATEQAYSAGSEGTSLKGNKSPAKALAIALIPGFFIHGLGHLYVGEGKTAGILFMVESVSIAAFSAVEPALISPSGPSRWQKGIIFMSFAGFFVSWMIDVWGAPTKAAKMRYGFEFTIRMNPDSRCREPMAQLCFQYEF